jgi:hypothetical protein
MATLVASPGVSGQFPIITLKETGDTIGLAVPMMQDITIDNANDVFTWTQLNVTAKLQVATTSTNSISGTLVVDDDVFFGKTTVNEAAQTKGLLGLSRNKVLVDFTIAIGAKTLSGKGYVTGIAPTVSADSPVWTSPLTITVTGEYTVA